MKFAVGGLCKLASNRRKRKPEEAMLQGKRRSGTKVQEKDTKFELCESIEMKYY